MKLDFSDLGGGKIPTAGVAGAGAQLDFSDLEEGPTTPGGESLTPVEMVVPEVSDEIAREAGIADLDANISASLDDLRNTSFNIPDDIISMPRPSLSDVMLEDLKDAYDTQKVNETARINRVLNDLVPNYAGGEENGVLTFGDRDSLSRMPRFEQREAWMKRKFPDGQLFRVDTGGGDLVEMYRTSPQGDAYRVSNDVLSFSDAGAVTGALGNFTTAGSVVGAFFGAFFGTTGGAYLGATIDEYIANSMATDKYLGAKTQEEFKTKLLSGDRAAMAIVDGVLTRVLPNMGRGGKHLLKKAADIDTTDTSLLYELGFFSVNKKAAQAQAAAVSIGTQTGTEIPLLNISQLSNNILVRGMASQASGTAQRLPQALSTQESRLLTALNKKVKDSDNDFGALSEAELRKYIELQHYKLGEDVQLAYRAQADGNYALRDSPEVSSSLVDNAKQLDSGFRKAIDQAYKRAFGQAGAANVTIDLTPLITKARQIKEGLPVTKKPELGRTPSGMPLKKGKSGQPVFAAEETIRSRPFGGELADIIRRLETFDPTLKSVKVKAVGGESASKNVDAFQQLKDIRDQLSDVASKADGVEGTRAVELIEVVDDLIVNGIEKGLVKGGDDAWRTSFNEAGALVRMRSDAKQFASLGTLLGRRAENLPQTVSEELLDGKINAEQFKVIKRLANNKSLNPDTQTAGRSLIDDIKDKSLVNILQKTDMGFEQIQKLKEIDKGRLYNDLFPVGSSNRLALDAFEEGAAKLATDPAQAAINKEFTDGQAAMKYIQSFADNRQDLAMQKFINANGGVDGKAGEQLRAVLLKRILDKSTRVQKEGGTDEFAEDIVDSSILADELSKLQRAINDPVSDNEYAAFKPLFGNLRQDGKLTFSEKGRKYFDLVSNVKLYSAFLADTGDVGGPFATGAIRSAVSSATVSGTLSAAKSLFTNRVLAKMFAARPSVSQLEKAINQKKFAGRINAGVTLFNQTMDALNVGEESGLSFYGSETSSSLGPETTTEETDRTGKPPQTGIVPQKISSVAPTTPAPTQLASAPQIQPPPRASQGAGITNFSSLFPRDELGGAIANRRNQGIMGLA
jgi:hypothetical protein